MTVSNINTPSYWDDVYRREWEAGVVESGNYSRDYGPVHDAVVGLVPDGSSVFDIACGPGLLCRKIKERLPATRVTGADFSAYTVQRNQQRDAALGIRYLHLDIRNGLSSVADRFDVITMCEVLEHLDEPETVVDAAMGLLRAGGRFIITCPHDHDIPDPEHVRIWGHDELFHLLARHGRTVSFVHFPPPYFHIWMLGYVTKEPLTPVN
jgi:2-polyprenyl-3-methyl-5-hydroxy-6-metoxy-1,4-benzoquinol methylase